MKKLLCFVLCLLVMPVMVFADMGAPSISEYEVIVSNPDGVKLYYDGDYITTIPYDTILTITYEESSNNTLYGYTEYDEEYGYIDLSNTTLYSTDIDFSTHFESGNGREVYVYKDGCYMYLGPSQIYGRNGVEIPVGTTLEILYYDEVWSYVEYNGVSGWIYTYELVDRWNLYDNLDVAVANINTNGSKLITVKNANVYDNDGNKMNISIPLFTVLEYDYYSYTDLYYITYDGVSGWIYANYEEAPAMSLYEGSVLTYDKVTLYERNSYMTYTESGITLPINYQTEVLCWNEYESEHFDIYSVCQIAYENNTYYIVNIDEVYDEDSETWIDIESAYVSKRTDVYAFIINKDIDLYDEINGSVISTISEGTILQAEYYKVSIDYNDYLYVTYDGVSGWIQYEDEYVTDYEGSYEDLLDTDDASCETDCCETDCDEINNTSVFKNILIAFIVALVIALTAIVLTIYINKKKNNKNVSN